MIRRLCPVFAVVLAAWLTIVHASPVQSFEGQYVDRILHEQCDGLFPVVKADADSGNASAVESLAVMYDRGCDTDQDMHRAAQLFDQARSSGSPDLLARGYTALYGANHSRDEANGLTILARAANGGEPFAAHILAWHYGTRVNIADLRRAYDWDVVGAKQGDLRSKAWLLQAELSGKVVPRSVSHALEALQRPEFANDSTAVGDLGLANINGIGVRRNATKGFGLLQRAATMGSARAKLALVMLYIHAGNREAIASDGLRLLSSAMRVEPHDAAAVNLGVLYLGQSGVPADYSRAVALFREAAATGSAPGNEYLGYCYLNGFGVPQSAEKGRAYLKEASLAGDATATRVLASLDGDAQGGMSPEYIAELMRMLDPGYNEPAGYFPFP